MTSLGPATAIHIVPIGFSIDPPVGPAIPVVAIAKSLLKTIFAPAAISWAHCMLTAPYFSIVSFFTPKTEILTSLL